MFEFLFGNKNSNNNEKSVEINNIYSALKKAYPSDKISEERKKELSGLIKKYGYLPYPYIKALEELTPEEILFGLEIKWADNGIFKDGKFDYLELFALPDTFEETQAAGVAFFCCAAAIFGVYFYILMRESIRH